MNRFPILIGYEGTIGPCPSWIPWDAIAPYEGQAQINHQQTLAELARRGGLGPMEAYLVMTGRPLDRIHLHDDFRREACAFLDKIVKDERALAFQNSKLRKALESCVPQQQNTGGLKLRWDALALTPTQAEDRVEAMEKVCEVLSGTNNIKDPELIRAQGALDAAKRRTA